MLSITVDNSEEINRQKLIEITVNSEIHEHFNVENKEDKGNKQSIDRAKMNEDCTSKTEVNVSLARNSTEINKDLTRNSTEINKDLARNSTEINEDLTRNSTEIDEVLTRNSTDINKVLTRNITEINEYLTRNNTETNEELKSQNTEVKVDLKTNNTTMNDDFKTNITEVNEDIKASSSDTTETTVNINDKLREAETTKEPQIEWNKSEKENERGQKREGGRENTQPDLVESSNSEVSSDISRIDHRRTESENNACDGRESLPQITMQDIAEKLTQTDIVGNSKLMSDLSHVTVSTLHKLQHLDKNHPAVKRLFLMSRLTTQEVKRVTIDPDIKTTVKEFLRSNMTGNFSVGRVLRENFSTFYSWLATHLQTERNAWVVRLAQAFKQVDEQRRVSLSMEDVITTASDKLEGLCQDLSSIQVTPSSEEFVSQYQVKRHNSNESTRQFNTNIMKHREEDVDKYVNIESSRTEMSKNELENPVISRISTECDLNSTRLNKNVESGENDSINLPDNLRTTENNQNINHCKRTETKENSNDSRIRTIYQHSNICSQNGNSFSFIENKHNSKTSKKFHRSSSFDEIYLSDPELSTECQKHKTISKSFTIQRKIRTLKKERESFLNSLRKNVDTLTRNYGEELERHIKNIIEKCDVIVQERQTCLDYLGSDGRMSLPECLCVRMEDLKNKKCRLEEEIEHRVKTMEKENRLLVQEMNKLHKTLVEKNSDALNLNKQLEKLEILVTERKRNKITVNKCVGTEDLKTVDMKNLTSRSSSKCKINIDESNQQLTYQNHEYLKTKTPEINNCSSVKNSSEEKILNGKRHYGKYNKDKILNLSPDTKQIDLNQQSCDRTRNFSHVKARDLGTDHTLNREESLIEISEEKLQTLKERAKKLEESLQDAISSITSIDSLSSNKTMRSDKTSGHNSLNSVVTDRGKNNTEDRRNSQSGLGGLTGKKPNFTPTPRLAVIKRTGPDRRCVSEYFIEKNFEQNPDISGNHRPSEFENNKNINVYPDSDSENTGNDTTLLFAKDLQDKLQEVAQKSQRKRGGSKVMSRRIVSKCLRCQKLFNPIDNHKLACCYHAKGRERLEHYDETGRLMRVMYAWRCCGQPQEADGCVMGKHV